MQVLEEICIPEPRSNHATRQGRTTAKWATKPIWQLPFTVVGEYEGQRSQAKAMAKLLSILWEIPEEDKGDSGTDGRRDKGGPQSRRSAGAKKGGKAKMKGLSHHRKRGGGHRQSWY